MVRHGRGPRTLDLHFRSWSDTLCLRPPPEAPNVSLRSALALALLLAGPAAAQKVGNRTETGTLKSVDEKANAVVLELKSGKELKLPFNPDNRVIAGKPLPTSFTVRVPGSDKLLTVGTAVYLSNVKFDWSDAYNLKDARVVLFPFQPPPKDRFEWTGDRESFFTATVTKADPLEVRLTGPGVPATIEVKKGAGKPMKFQVGGKPFALSAREVTVDLGKNLALAGKDARVRAIIYTPAETAQELQIDRTDPVTADELKQWAKKK